MGILTVDVATKRLQNIVNSQESIETTSMWVLHHTDSIRVIVDVWLNIFRAATEENRISQFYLMNDIVQRAKKKHMETVCSVFEPAVASAVNIGKSAEKLRGVMSRCLKLITECKGFSSRSLEKMGKAIADPSGEMDDANLDVDNVDLAKKIEAFARSVAAVTKGYEAVKRAPINFTDQISTRMKDRKEGGQLLREAQQAIYKAERFREAMSHNMRYTYELIETLENAKRAFNLQLRDVAFVEDAYVKFGQGLREVQEEVEEMLRTATYPSASPPRDAPSPSAEDDVFAAGVEQALNTFRPRDVLDTTDMEVEEDTGPPPGAIFHRSSTVPSSMQPPRSAQAAAIHAMIMKPVANDPRSRSTPVQQQPTIAQRLATSAIPIPLGQPIQSLGTQHQSAAPAAAAYSLPPPVMPAALAQQQQPPYGMPPPGYPPPSVQNTQATNSATAQPMSYGVASQQAAYQQPLTVRTPSQQQPYMMQQGSYAGTATQSNQGNYAAHSQQPQQHTPTAPLVSPHGGNSYYGNPPPRPPSAQGSYAGAATQPTTPCGYVPAPANQFNNPSYGNGTAGYGSAGYGGEATYNPSAIQRAHSMDEGRGNGDYDERQGAQKGPGTPYTPSAPGYMGRKGDGAISGGTPRGGYGTGGYGGGGGGGQRDNRGGYNRGGGFGGQGGASKQSGYQGGDRGRRDGNRGGYGRRGGYGGGGRGQGYDNRGRGRGGYGGSGGGGGGYSNQSYGGAGY